MKTENAANDRRAKSTSKWLIRLYTASACGGVLFSIAGIRIPHTVAANAGSLIDSATFTQQEFFGAEAVVPLPTSEARENLRRLADSNPGDPEILAKLAELDEKLSNFDEAEKVLFRLAEIDPAKTESLVAFYRRHARFEDEAAVLRKILTATPPEMRSAVLERLLDLARTHDLKQYLRPEFYRRLAAENTDAFPVIWALIERLCEEKNYDEALRFVRQAENQFPDRKQILLEKEVSLLSEMEKGVEAEKVYIASFDPFWSDEKAENFYEFLSERDRLREYGGELKTKFDRDPADFETAIRLAHYRAYWSEEIVPIFSKLEKSKQSWTADQLLTATRFLIRKNELAPASRFLYTLYNRGDLDRNSELRAKILYQLFEIFSDAGAQRLPLTHGDLRFYEEVATIDTDPGIATGILSLIFSDTDPKARLAEKEKVANHDFNSAAAYRVFLEYREENPSSPELAQMYLDIVRLYTAAGDTDVAEKTLNEFAERYKNSANFPQAALKLADAYAATKRPEESCRIYREILDAFSGGDVSSAESTSGSRNAGIRIPGRRADGREATLLHPSGHDFLVVPEGPVTYREVLEHLVDALAKEKKGPEILEVLSAEIAKHPRAEWLYEWRLSWLEQTNLTDQQLAAYREALERFQSPTWSDKLARWFLREKRQSEFSEFSSWLVEKLDDAEVKDYLSQFIDPRNSTSEFEKQLYLQLYKAALKRFPHEQAFVEGLLRFYRINKRETEWRNLAASYYFEMPTVRKLFLDDLAEKGELRHYRVRASGDSAIYKLFHADASVRLSNFEAAVGAYRELTILYPNTPEFSEKLIALSRSLGQKDPSSLAEAANAAYAQAEFQPESADFRTRSGEIFAEFGDYQRARYEWEKLPSIATGEKDVYLKTATVYWDYFQYKDALRTIGILRKRFSDRTLYAFEAGAIHESLHDMRGAISEYVKALGSTGDREEQKQKAVRRLAVLAKRDRLESEIAAAFAAESSRRKDPSFLSLGYAEVLAKLSDTGRAEQILNPTIAVSHDTEFLEAARDFFSEEEIAVGERTALKRLGDIAESPRQRIRYRFQLAEAYEQGRDREAARRTLAELITTFPNRYGVITEVADKYRRLGFDDDSVAVLQNALTRSRGEYRTRIAARLSKRLVQLDRIDTAEQLLLKLHDENAADLDLFRELAGIYVRKSEPELLKKEFSETVAALKNSDDSRREVENEIADLRRQMIDAFTRLKDYRSAIEQHIEIINREPKNDSLTDDAIAYARRYGEAGTLLAYYQKTSNEAFKNYRWNVVLARIYEAGGDLENAVRNYQAAIVNQPEMPELYMATAEIETRRNNFDGAISYVDVALELTNDDPEYIKKKIEILKKAGRLSEAEAETTKLPKDDKPGLPAEPFSEAREIANTDKDKAREVYGQAFVALLRNPLGGELSAAGVSGYVQSMREEESLDRINERLWDLRAKLIAISDEAGSINAGEARNRLSVLEGAITESVGSVLKTIATDDELAAIHADLSKRVEETAAGSDIHRTLNLIRDISRRASMGDLEEKILLKKLTETDPTIRQTPLRDLVNFYDSRGAFDRSLAVIEQYGTGDPLFIADHARFAGDIEKELAALRDIYAKPAEKLATAPDEYVARYLEILYQRDRDELKSLTARSSVFQFQLINFLLGKGERELAHAAIGTAEMSQAWKLSRQAEVSLALREFGNDAECYFCEALQFGTIGEMMRQIPDKQRFLVGDDWFRLTREFGEWLSYSPQTARPSLYLTALIEDRPHDAAEQSSLGLFYLKEKNAKAAIEHFRLAVEEDPDDTAALADLGSVYYVAGEKDRAIETWNRALAYASSEGEVVEFFRTMKRNGLAAEARQLLVPYIVKILEKSDIQYSNGGEILIREIAVSFENPAQSAGYFAGVLNKRPSDTSLAKFLLEESLIDSTHSGIFYERLINSDRNAEPWDSDYNFQNISHRTWTLTDAESVYDQENDYKIDEPGDEKYLWQKKYAETMIDTGENQNAAVLIARVEDEIRGRFPRPVWLRLAKLRLGARAGNLDLVEAKRFIGIIVSASATDVKPPDIERFNDTLTMLKEEKADGAAAQISESFFARDLALGQFDAANFTGLASAWFQKGNTEHATQVLRLMVDVANVEKRPEAIAEIANLPSVKTLSADAAKTAGNGRSNFPVLPDALELAARTAAAFDQSAQAAAFRKNLLEISPANAANRIELGRVIAHCDRKAAIDLLTQVVTDRNVARMFRWQAKWQLREMGEPIEIASFEYDPYSQFYRGLASGNSSQAGVFFANSLIAGTEAAIPAGQALIKRYAASGRPFAALKLAESFQGEKPDELLSILSAAAEAVGYFEKAIEFENARPGGGNTERIFLLRGLGAAAGRRRTHLAVDSANTRKL